MVVFVGAAAEILRRHHRVARRDPIARLPVVQGVACRHVHPAANVLRSVHGILPVRKRPARSSGSRRRRRAGGGRVARVGFGFAGVEVRHEYGVVVEAFDVEKGGEHGLWDHGAEGVALVFRAGVDEIEGCVGEVDGEGVVGGGDGEVG